MAQRRTRNAERIDVTNQRLDRRANILADFISRPCSAQIANFKVTSYDGSTDIECFTHQSQDVCVANRWDDGASLLHLRTKLKEGARDCRLGDTVEAVFYAFRSRDGMIRREAGAKFSRLKREVEPPFIAMLMK